jgi:hypothetical protein
LDKHVTILSSRGFDQDVNGGPRAVAEATEQPARDLDPPRTGTLAQFLLASPLCGPDLDIARATDAPRDIEL